MKNFIYLFNNSKTIKSLVLGLVLFLSYNVSLDAQCMTCPSDVTVIANNGTCEMFVQIPDAVATGSCVPAPSADYDSGMFPVGTTVVTYTAGSGVDFQTCHFNVIVEDTEAPIFTNCESITMDLDAGECSALIYRPLLVEESCGPLPVVLTQSNDMTTLGAPSNICNSGDNHYFRVFDMTGMGQFTDLDITGVNMGVFQSFPNAKVVVNIYTLVGTLATGQLTLLESNFVTLPILNEEMTLIPITTTVASDEVMVVEIITQGELFAGKVMATNNLGETGQSYYKSGSCGSNLVNMTGQLVMSVVGEGKAYKLTQTDNSGLTMGDEFPVGVTQQSYTVVDASGNSTDCNFTVTINGFVSPITSMVCNNLVQVSLDDNCEAFLGADEILEGGSYSCYTDYTIHITDQFGNDIGNHLTGEHAGQTLDVTIESPGGNSCWGKVSVEDKIGPVLECEDVFTSCAGSTDPGSNAALDVTFLASQNGNISDGIPNQVNIKIPVFGLTGATIKDVNLKLNIKHTDISNLKVSLKAPNGTIVNLFDAPTAGNANASCTHENLKLIMDDEASNAYSLMDTDCANDVFALEGSYKPSSSLSAFDNMDPNGDWTLIISDLVAGDGGKLKEAKLVIRQTGAKIKLPIPSGATYKKIAGTNSFRVFGLDPCGPAILSYTDNTVEQDCSTNLTEIIERTWIAVDENGNSSVPCIQLIYVNITDSSDIVWPPNYDDQPGNNNHLSCTQWKDEVPGPNVTGYPSAISGELCDNIQIFPPVDTRIDICESSYKILRYWKLVEWCTGDILEHTQVIKVLDDKIIISCPQEEIESTEGTYSCAGSATLPIPTVLNECSGWWYEVKWFREAGDPVATDIGVSYNAQTNQYTIVGLREGINVVEYTAIDSCGNEDVCTVEINVKDEIKPTVVCDQFTKVSIAADGKAVVNAITFDDGSTDNCGIVFYEARKMTNTCEGFNTDWYDQLIFCCDEIGTTVMVEFAVEDAGGNRNSCMVEVTVEDKLPPYITQGPPNLTLKCTDDWTDLTLTGEPQYIDNCGIVSVGYKDNENIDNCGVGRVTRVWTVVDGVGLKDSYTQIITIIDTDPFTYGNITWPSDYDFHGCSESLHPDDFPVKYAYPRFKKEDACNLVAATYKDQRFNIVDGSCVKILRTWTVIDWCTYNEMDPGQTGATGIWEKTQIIKLTNQEAPVFASCSNFDVCAYVNCDKVPSVTLTQSATDDCTETKDLYWSYEVDLWNDGSVDYSGYDSIVTKKMPYGDHLVTWVVGDKCGNTTRCQQKFKVKDCKKPTPYCYGQVVTTVMNNNGEIEIWAKDYNIGAYDNCTLEEDLIFSFTGSTSLNARKKVFTCADIPNGEEALIPVNIWVIDEAGNKDYCEVVLKLQDNESHICDPIEGSLISGNVMTELQDMIPDALVSYTSGIVENEGQMMTEDNGHYSFNVGTGQDYSISIDKSDDPMNGVSTLDLLLIQRHILKLKELNSPYKIIAADIDDNSKINANDLIQLRKLILGKIPNFPGTQKEWRFVDQSYVFADEKNPFPYNESIDIENLSTNMREQHFYGVKIGDVNNDIHYNAQSTHSEDRYGESLSLYTRMESFNSEEELLIPIRIADLTSLTGMQFTLDMNSEVLSYGGILPGKLQVDENNVGLSLSERGKVLFSWSDLDVVNLNKEDVLFTLVFNTIGAGNTQEAIQINSDVTLAEAYTKDLTIKGINFKVKGSNLMEEAVLYQNTPNPFIAVTNIAFYLPESSTATLSILDISGRVIRSVKGNYKKGINSVQFDLNDSHVNGLLYYQIEADNFTAIKKMIIVE